MTELNFDSPEVHTDWLSELCKKRKKLKDLEDVHFLEYFWFYKGCPVEESAFKSICNQLGVNWEEVQKPKENNKCYG
jgi:hypothetical protein